MCDSNKARRRRYEVIFRSCCETNSFSTICPFSSHFPLCTLTAFKQFIAKKKDVCKFWMKQKRNVKSDYFLKNARNIFWRICGGKKVQGLVRSQPALIYLSNIFPKLLFLCVCRFDRGSFCFISWFCLKTRSRVQRPDQRWSLSALHTQPSVSWWLMSDLAQVDFQFKCQISDESFCCKMLFSVAIVWK